MFNHCPGKTIQQFYVGWRWSDPPHILDTLQRDFLVCDVQYFIWCSHIMMMRRWRQKKHGMTTRQSFITSTLPWNLVFIPFITLFQLTFSLLRPVFFELSHQPSTSSSCTLIFSAMNLQMELGLLNQDHHAKMQILFWERHVPSHTSQATNSFQHLSACKHRIVPLLNLPYLARHPQLPKPKPPVLLCENDRLLLLHCWNLCAK